ncbi:MAG TPA: secretin N-terminal domain-containing protein [Nitrospirota bacterium]|nr:secretin N-terminal domain-containing protein [Nitrospirota bacterium]
MRKITALLLLIGLVCAPGSFAGNRVVVAQETSTAVKSTPVATMPTVSVSTEAATAVAQPASNQVAPKKAKAGDDFVTLNFTNIDIGALVKVMSELMHRNFLLDERVVGKVTIMTPMKISPAEAYQVFLSALEIKGFTAVEDGKVTRIIPAANARQSGIKVVEDGITAGEGFVTKLIRLNFINPQEIVRTITPLISRDGSIIAYPPTSSIILTDSVSNIRKIESLVHAMDVAAPEGKGKINVYYLKNANAEDTAKLMQAVIAHLPVPPPPGSPQAAASPTAMLEGTVTVAADKATNSLIVVGTPADFETIKDVIQKLDIKRRQVFVEVAIIEMSLTKVRDLGFEFQATNLQNLESSNTTNLVGGTNFGNIGNAIVNGPAGLAALSGLAVGAVKGTFTFKGVEYLNVGALLTALQTDTDVNVLSTPNILTMDNQKAEIMVGENVPFITGSTQNATTGSTAIFNTITRQDVGIKLTLTPQIASDDSVRLEVDQEISSVIATSTSNPAGPTTDKRSASTTVVVKDRQTMVIGGLITDNVTKTTSKVPFLGDIPILGWLFKTQSSNVEKDDLMIFITPYIIKNEGEASDLTKQRSESLDQFRKEYNIEKKKELQSDLLPKVSDTTKQPASSATGTTGARMAPALKTGATPSPAEGVPAGTPAMQAPDLNTEVTVTMQSPSSVAAPKEGAR